MRKLLLIMLGLAAGIYQTCAQSLYFTSGRVVGLTSQVIMNVQGPTNLVCWLERLSASNGTWSIVGTYTIPPSGTATLTNALDLGYYGVFRTRSTNGSYFCTNGFGGLMFTLNGEKTLVGSPFATTSVTNIFPAPPTNMYVAKWNGSGYDTSTYDGSGWDDPTMTFGSTEGLWVYGPSTNSSIVYVTCGVFRTNETVILPTGYSLVTSPRFRFWTYPHGTNMQVDLLSGTNGYYGGLSGLPAESPGYSPQAWLYKYDYFTNGFAEYQFRTNNVWSYGGIVTNTNTIPLNLIEGFFFRKPTSNNVWNVTRPIF
ncbi:MAG TPA: hypothetical protein VMF06_05420 [Candidatus Limnocylindria bacterium]|jgi:hypothetical protein|nr:hypothetical protein [Candidatus Limnocylindria bacterium]